MQFVELLLEFIRHYLYCVSSFIFICLFSEHFKRRSHFWARFAFANVVCVTLGILGGLYTYYLGTKFSYSWIIYALMSIVVIAMHNVCYKQGLMRNIYSLTVMALTRNMVTCISKIIISFVDMEYEGNFFWIPQLMVEAAMVTLVYFLVTKKMSRDIRFKVDPKSTITIGIIAMLILPMSIFEQYLKSSMLLFIYFHIIQAMVDATLLGVQIFVYFISISNIEKALEKHLLSEQISVSANFRDVVEKMNIKVHDLKHQVRELKEGRGSTETSYIDELEDAAKEYENFIDVGNEHCNVVLTEKLHLCSLDDIRMTIMLDGKDLEFLSPTDIYSLLGNLIDNAMRYLKGIEKDKRFIRVSCTTNIENVYILRVENYFEGELRLDDDGLPITTQKDTLYHGYGVKSISSIARKYGGNATFKAEDELFKATIVLMKK